jgi:hypothetical protein
LAKSESVVKRKSRAMAERERKEVIWINLEEKGDALRDKSRRVKGYSRVSHKVRYDKVRICNDIVRLSKQVRSRLDSRRLGAFLESLLCGCPEFI